MNQRIPFHLKYKDGNKFFLNYFYQKEVHSYHNLQYNEVNDKIFSIFNLHGNIATTLLDSCKEGGFYYLEIETSGNCNTATLIEDVPSPEYLKITLSDNRELIRSSILEKMPDYFNYYDNIAKNNYYFYDNIFFSTLLSIMDEVENYPFYNRAMGKDFIPHKIGMRDYIIDNVLNK